MKRFLIPVILVLAAAGAPAEAAAAPAILTPKCVRYYGNGSALRYVPILGAGFGAGEQVRLNWGVNKYGGLAAYKTANSTGVFAGQYMFGPDAEITTKRHFRTYLLSARTYPSYVFRTKRKVHFVKVDVTYNIQHPKRKTRYRFYGFPSGRVIWAHYWFRGRQRAVVRMGRARGACGVTSRRLRALPARFRVGTWTVYYTSHRGFNRRAIHKKHYFYRSQFYTYVRYFRHASVASAG